jgi:formiminotetrahydrofolate cyclodeaminase
LDAIGNPKVLSDVEVGHLLAVAGLKAARVNVKINLDGIKDKSFCEAKLVELDAFRS